MSIGGFGANGRDVAVQVEFVDAVTVPAKVGDRWILGLADGRLLGLRLILRVCRLLGLLSRKRSRVGKGLGGRLRMR